MKLIILWNDYNGQVLTISEGNHGDLNQYTSCKGKNLTTRHTWVMKAPRVATVQDTVKESGRVLPCPSAVFHVYASVDTPWVAWTLSHFTPMKRGKVSSNSATHESTMFAGPHKSHMRQYTTQTCSPEPDNRTLIDRSWGYHLGALNFRLDHSSSFPSSILPFPLIAPPGLHLSQPFDYVAEPHRTSIGRKSPITSRFHPLDFYW
jgi:hypothetical protein